MKVRTSIIVSIIVLAVAGAVAYLELARNRSGMALTARLSEQAESADLKPQGRAPEFAGIAGWLNSEPLALSDLRGKVVLVDFWTYSCINCIRTLPYVTRWYDTYRDSGLVVVGVHTPEFDFEKNPENVRTAIKRHAIRYPVAQDNDYQTWRAYGNHYWPAMYLIDQNGQVVYSHFGEGDYEATENAIRKLLGLNFGAQSEGDSLLGNIQSPEMYFGLNRLQNLTPEQIPAGAIQLYQLPLTLKLNRFALAGAWQFTPEFAILIRPPGNISLRFFASSVFMVAAADKPVSLKIVVDGVAQSDVTVQASQLYTLFESKEYREREIDIQIPEAGLRAFTFTFG